MECLKLQFERCQGIAASKLFRFKDKLFSLDATVIDLYLEIFDWAKFHRAKGAIKLHLLRIIYLTTE